jgi:hypothetical protein
MSHRAVDVLRKFFDGSVELLPIDGIGESYTGFHCVNWLDAAELEYVDQNRQSIHSSLFVPTLNIDIIRGQDVFGDPRMVTKLFVSEQVRRAVISNHLTGLEFHQAPFSALQQMKDGN